MTALEPMIALYAAHRKAGEGFGAFCLRYGVEAMRQAVVDAHAAQHKWAA
jgi:sulfite reductase beta subunit-like hemoprotein